MLIGSSAVSSDSAALAPFTAERRAALNAPIAAKVHRYASDEVADASLRGGVHSEYRKSWRERRRFGAEHSSTNQPKSILARHAPSSAVRQLPQQELNTVDL